MSVELLEGIHNLETDSLCHSIYIQLYNNFFNAQDKKDAEHPWGIEEGDELSVRLRNTAYGFAEAIAGAVGGEGSGTGSETGGILLHYLQKSGGDMSGYLRSNYGFEAGIGNAKLLETILREFTNEDGEVVSEERGIRILDRLEIGADKLFIGGKQFLAYNSQTDSVDLRYPKIDFGNSDLFVSGKLLIGTAEKGVVITPELFSINGFSVYHTGNANLAEVDWIMNNSLVYGSLHVAGPAFVSDTFSAKNGFELGIDNKTILSVAGNDLLVESNIAFGRGFGIKIEDILVLGRVNDNDIQLGSIGGDLLLGNENTKKIKLFSNLTDIDGDYTLITPYGSAYFPDSLKVSHNYGDTLLSTYREDRNNEGIIIHKRLRLGSETGAFFSGNETILNFHSYCEHINPDTNEKTNHNFTASVSFVKSASLLTLQDRLSFALQMNTDSDLFLFAKAIESKERVGIENSFTRIQNGALFLSKEHYFLSTTDGIKHYGNAYILNDISSEFFSTGFAGSGWGIIKNKTTGNTGATFDELTVRKKMRIYEMEVQKISATNGSLWVSDNCSGDTVEKVESGKLKVES